MDKGYKNIFQNLDQIEPPHQLYPSIIRRIEMEKTKVARMRFVLFSGATLTALVAIFPAFQYVAQELTNNGFSQYISLIFSDGGTMLAYWQEFTLALAESLPIFGLIILLTIISALLGSLKMTMDNVPAAFRQHKLIKI